MSEIWYVTDDYATEDFPLIGMYICGTEDGGTHYATAPLRPGDVANPEVMRVKMESMKRAMSEHLRDG